MSQHSAYGLFQPMAYALVMTRNVMYLAPAVLESQDPRAGTAIYRVYLPDRDLLLSVGHVSTVTLYVREGRRWRRIDSAFLAVSTASVAVALPPQRVSAIASSDTVDVTRAVVETTELVGMALSSIPAIIPLAMEFERRTRQPWVRLLYAIRRIIRMAFMHIHEYGYGAALDR